MEQPGVYFGKLKKVGIGALDNDKKTPLIFFEFNLTHRSNQDGNWDELPEPIDREARMFLSDAAWPYTKDKLKAMGFNGDFENPVVDVRYAESGAQLVCKHREGTGGKLFEEWELAEWAGGSKEYQSVSKDQVRLFNGRWKNEMAAGAKPNGTPPAPPKTTKATPPPAAVGSKTKDEMPF